MKYLKLTLAALGLSAVLALPAAADLKDDVARLGVRVLAEKFGVDGRVADRYLLRDRDICDLAPVFSTSYHTHRPVDEVWKLREQGLGWGQISHKLGMHPGTFNKLRKSGAFDRDRIWGSVLKDKYGASESDLASIKRNGGTMQDTLHVYIVAHESGKKPMEVFGRYRKDRDWDRTAADFKSKDHDNREHADAHRESHDEGHPAQPEKEHGRGHGNGHGNGNGKGRGHGRGN
jgi:hypothetical protein